MKLLSDFLMKNGLMPLIKRGSRVEYSAIERFHSIPVYYIALEAPLIKSTEPPQNR